MIVVVGESLIDVGAGDQGPHESVGGSPLNVAVALGRLEVPVLLVTETGSDERATTIAAHLAAADVEVISAPTPSGRTPTATVILDDGDPLYTVDLTWDLPHTELPECDALHIGSLATVLEPGRDTVLDLVEQAWARDVFVSYDPNVRAGHLTDHDHDQAWGDIESLANRAQLVKLSEQDVEFLHPGADPGQIARSLLTGEATELVILTRGARGASAYTEAGEVHTPGNAVEVQDTVGAGDAFMAAVLAVLFESDSLGHFGPGLPNDAERLDLLLRAANQAAGLSCSRAGAAAPLRADLPDGWPSGTPA
ncbi:MAG: carbohydrate kinase [Propionibacteriales bacterium]|nr:carbohydrate kinase [Propionibacteriales bacterium]